MDNYRAFGPVWFGEAPGSGSSFTSQGGFRYQVPEQAQMIVALEVMESGFLSVWDMEFYNVRVNYTTDMVYSNRIMETVPQV